MKFLKVGRVAIITRGRYAGKKVCTRRKKKKLLFEELNKRLVGYMVDWIWHNYDLREAASESLYKHKHKHIYGPS